MTLEQDLARVRTQRAGELVDERGLAGAVGTDQRVDLSAPHAKIDVIGGDQPTEMLVQLPDLQKLVSHRQLSRADAAARTVLRCL